MTKSVFEFEKNTSEIFEENSQKIFLTEILYNLIR